MRRDDPQRDSPPEARATPIAISIPEEGSFPNNPRLPLVLVPGAIAMPPDHPDPAALFEKAFDENGWHGSWRNGVFDFHHFHSTAHEALGVFQGEAEVRFGGPNGVVKRIQAGDLVVIPAGVSHQRVRSSPDFGVVGAYPAGQRHDMRYGKPGERPQADQNIARVPLPAADPLFGPHGPLLKLWPAADGSSR